MEGVGIAPFTPHDLRRTGRAILSRLGIPREDIKERVINHSMSTVEGTYDLWEYIDEKRAALEKWEHYLKELRDSPPLTKKPSAPPAVESVGSPGKPRTRCPWLTLLAPALHLCVPYQDGRSINLLARFNQLG